MYVPEETAVWRRGLAVEVWLVGCRTSFFILLQSRKNLDLQQTGANPLTDVGLGCTEVKTGLGPWFSA